MYKIWDDYTLITPVKGAAFVFDPAVRQIRVYTIDPNLAEKENPKLYEKTYVIYNHITLGVFWETTAIIEAIIFDPCIGAVWAYPDRKINNVLLGGLAQLLNFPKFKYSIHEGDFEGCGMLSYEAHASLSEEAGMTPLGDNPVAVVYEMEVTKEKYIGNHAVSVTAQFNRAPFDYPKGRKVY